MFSISYVLGEVNENFWVVDLTSPVNSGYDNSTTVAYKCLVDNRSANHNLLNVSLYTNQGGTWVIKASNTSGVANTTYTFSVGGDGVNTWNCFATFNRTTDGVKNVTYESSNFSVTVDSVAPVITNTSLYNTSSDVASNKFYSGTIDVNVSLDNSTGRAYNTTSAYHMWANWSDGSGDVYTEITIDDTGVSSGRLSADFDTSTISDGTYNLTIKINETGDTNSDEAVNNLTNLTIDNTGPSATLSDPDDADAIITVFQSIKYTCSGGDDNGGGISYVIESTKPGGVKVTKSSSSATFTGEDNNEIGVYTVVCKTTSDVFFKRTGTSASKTYTVKFDSGGGGGSGGDDEPARKIFDIDFRNIGTDTFLRRVGSKVSFTFDGTEEHTITLTRIDGDKLTIVIASTPKTYQLGVGESVDVDINEDGTNNLRVGVSELTENNARLTLTKLEAPPAIVPEPTPEVTPEPIPTPEPSSTPIVEGGTMVKESKAGKTLLTVVIILAVVIGGYYLVQARNKKRRWPLK